MDADKNIKQKVIAVINSNTEMYKKCNFTAFIRIHKWEEKYNMKKSKRMVIAVIALFLLSGFIDLTPNYTVEELDDLYGTNIKDLSFTYKKEHHYSLLTHKKTEYVFRGTKQYSHYFNIVVSVADEKNYFVENKQDNKYRILAINVCGHNVDIKIMDRNTGACADAVIKLERGFIRITITTYDNVDIKDYWLDNPISDSSYISIFEDLLSVILKGESKI